jgi:nicotinamidase/pyrazinamidase
VFTLKHMPGIIVVDLQGDFSLFKKGALAVPDTDEMFINKIRNTTEIFKKEGYPIFAT